MDTYTITPELSALVEAQAEAARRIQYALTGFATDAGLAAAEAALARMPTKAELRRAIRDLKRGVGPVRPDPFAIPTMPEAVS